MAKEDKQTQEIEVDNVSTEEIIVDHANTGKNDHSNA